MSIGSITAGSALYASLISDNTTIKQKLDQLTEQISSGLTTQTYGGLGAEAAVPLTLGPQIAALKTWQGNIDAASGRMQVAQSALTQVQQIAAGFLAQTNDLEGVDANEVDTIAASARQALVQVADLLNTQDGGEYVFSGEDSASPAVPDASQILSSGFFTQIAAQVAQLGSQGAAATIANTLGIAGSNAAGTTPFSTYLSQPSGAMPPSIQVGSGQNVSVGILANANAAVTSGGSSTTGSYMRDIMRALATIGSLDSGQTTDPGFQTLVQDTNASLTGAVSAIAEDSGVLGNTQSNLTALQTTLSSTATALTTQVSSVEDVNVAAAMSNLSLVQTQLQASYQVTAALSGLSLAKFLPAQ
jgi:flagellar hook-associated protein 3 FlgL